MKKIIIVLLLYGGSIYSQKAKANFSIFYATGEMVGLELMFETSEGSHKYLGAGFTGALNQRDALGDYVSGSIEANEIPTSRVYEEFCSVYAIGSFGFIGPVLTKCKLGVGMYDRIENFEGLNKRYHKKDGTTYFPLVGASIMLPISESVGLELGGDCFNGASAGFTFIF